MRERCCPQRSSCRMLLVMRGTSEWRQHESALTQRMLRWGTPVLSRHGPLRASGREIGVSRRAALGCEHREAERSGFLSCCWAPLSPLAAASGGRHRARISWDSALSQPRLLLQLTSPPFAHTEAHTSARVREAPGPAQELERFSICTFTYE